MADVTFIGYNLKMRTIPDGVRIQIDVPLTSKMEALQLLTAPEETVWEMGWTSTKNEEYGTSGQ